MKAINNEWKKLGSYYRKNLAERDFFGGGCIVSNGKTLLDLNASNLVFGRSTLKPWMLKVFTQELAGIYSLQQKAMSVASHTAEDFHLKVATSLLPQEFHSALKTPTSVGMYGTPLDEPTKWKHACSAEHAAILQGCIQKKWPLENYQDWEHPFTKSYLGQLQRVLGSNWQPQIVAPDGCDLPTITMTLSELARLFEQLAIEKSQDWIWDSMTQAPEYVGGTRRLDSALMRSQKGRVLAKEGADGLIAGSFIGSSADTKHPETFGFVFKLSHGWDTQTMWFIISDMIKYFGSKMEINPFSAKGQDVAIQIPWPSILQDKFAD